LEAGDRSLILFSFFSTKEEKGRERECKKSFILLIFIYEKKEKLNLIIYVKKQKFESKIKK